MIQNELKDDLIGVLWLPHFQFSRLCQMLKILQQAYLLQTAEFGGAGHFLFSGNIVTLKSDRDSKPSILCSKKMFGCSHALNLTP